MAERVVFLVEVTNNKTGETQQRFTCHNLSLTHHAQPATLETVLNERRIDACNYATGFTMSHLGETVAWADGLFTAKIIHFQIS